MNECKHSRLAVEKTICQERVLRRLMSIVDDLLQNERAILTEVGSLREEGRSRMTAEEVVRKRAVAVLSSGRSFPSLDLLHIHCLSPLFAVVYEMLAKATD